MTNEPGGSKGIGLPGPRKRVAEVDKWIPWLFRFRSRGSILVVAATFSLGLFVLGGLITAALHAVISFDRGMVYHEEPIFYTYALWGFVFLWLLGHWSQGYVTLWKDLGSSFDVGEERYEEIVDGGLSLAYRLDIPFALFVPYQIVVEVVSPLSLANVPIPEMLVFEGFQIILNFLFIAILYLLFVHLLLMKRVLSLPLSNLYGAAKELEPLAEFSVSLAVKYFVNLALVIFTVYFLLNVEFSQYFSEAGIIDSQGLMSWELIWSLAMFGSYLLTWLLIFFLPIQMIHSRLREAKRAKLIELNKEYDRLYDQFLQDEDAEELTGRVEDLDQIRKQTEKISTWPFQLPSLLKVFFSSLAPAVVFVFELLKNV